VAVQRTRHRTAAGPAVPGRLWCSSGRRDSTNPSAVPGAGSVVELGDGLWALTKQLASFWRLSIFQRIALFKSDAFERRLLLAPARGLFRYSTGWRQAGELFIQAISEVRFGQRLIDGKMRRLQRQFRESRPPAARKR